MKKHQKELLVLVLSTVLLASGVIWLRTATVRDSYLYVRRVKEFQALQQKIQALRIEWLELTSPHQLESLSKKLALHPPHPTQVMKYAGEHRPNHKSDRVE